MKSRLKLAPLFRLLFALLIFAIALTLLIKGASDPATAHQTTPGQDEERSLEIARYPNEPLELIDLKIHENSVKDRINSKFKDKTKTGLDNVTFREKRDWFKNVKPRLRNTSGRPIYALNVSLVFKDDRLRMAFEVPLKQSEARDLRQNPLQPGQDVELSVDEAKLGQILAYMYQNGIDANQSGWRLSIDAAWFGDDFGWQKGNLLRRNSFDPKRWDKIDKADPSPFPLEASRLFQPAGFKASNGDPSRVLAMQADPTRCVAAVIG